MILVGIDSIEIERIKKTMTNTRFLQRFFGKDEFLQLEKRNFKPDSVAANVCA